MSYFLSLPDDEKNHNRQQGHSTTASVVVDRSEERPTKTGHHKPMDGRMFISVQPLELVYNPCFVDNTEGLARDQRVSPRTRWTILKNHLKWIGWRSVSRRLPLLGKLHKWHHKGHIGQWTEIRHSKQQKYLGRCRGIRHGDHRLTLACTLILIPTCHRCVSMNKLILYRPSYGKRSCR